MSFGQDVVSQKTVENWFNRFKSGNYSIEDEVKSGRTTELDDDELRELSSRIESEIDNTRNGNDTWH